MLSITRDIDGNRGTWPPDPGLPMSLRRRIIMHCIRFLEGLL